MGEKTKETTFVQACEWVAYVIYTNAIYKKNMKLWKSMATNRYKNEW